MLSKQSRSDDNVDIKFLPQVLHQRVRYLRGVRVAMRGEDEVSSWFVSMYVYVHVRVAHPTLLS